MGKRLKKKAARKEKDKEKRNHNSSKEAQDAADTDVGSVLQKENKGCVHIEKGVDFSEVSSKIESAESTACSSCRDSGKPRKAKPNQHKATWVCLQCGVFSCGGVALPNTQSHVLSHYRQYRHPLVIQLQNPLLIWCFPCSSLQPKHFFADLVTLIKTKSSPQPQSQSPSVDVEDIWFGGQSLVSEVKPPNCNDSYAVRGLVNLGNTCFFNSVLQNLLALDILRDYLLNFQDSMGPLMSSLKKIFVETSLESGSRNVINPRPLFGSVCAKAPQFKGYQQQDSHELLRYLLDGLSSEDSHAKKLDTSSVGDPSFVDGIFGGQTSSTVCCVECGHSSVVYEPFLDLSLPVPTKKPLSKKPQLMPRTKKKLPPKRGGKIRPKVNKNGDLGPAPNGLKIDSNGCGSSVNLVEPSALVYEYPMPQVNHSTESSCTGAQETQSASLIADGESSLNNNKPVSQNDSAQEVDCFTWMDYLEPVPSLEVPNLVSENENFSVPLDVESHDDDHHNVYMQNTTRPSIEDSLFQDSGVTGNYYDANSVPDMSKSSGEVCVNPEDVNLKSESTINDWSDECPLQVQDNEVLLLTYKEDGLIEGEEIKTDDKISLSAVCDDEDTLGFDGLGGLFDEPEEIEAGVKSMQVSEHVGNGFMVGNNTESDPDEVDDTNSPVSVESCLASFVKAELLTGEHAWHCENCSKLLKEERKRPGNNQKKCLGDVSNGNCSSSEVLQVTSPSFQDSSTELLLNHYNGSSETDLNVKKVDVMQANGHSLNLQRDEEKNCASESVDLNASGSTVCFKPSDEVSLDRMSLGSHVVHCNDVPVEGSSGPSEEQESGEDEEKEEDLKSVKMMRDATKRILISKIPPVLTIHLKRFGQDASGRLSKLNGHVGFKEYINLGHYMDSRSAKGRVDCTYRLVGVVEHSGSMRGGHYVAYVRGRHRRRGKSEEDRESSQVVWYHASDAYVRETTLESVLRCEAYLLFYEKVKP